MSKVPYLTNTVSNAYIKTKDLKKKKTNYDELEKIGIELV